MNTYEGRIHDLRHSFVGLPVIRTLFGHTQTKTSARYTNFLNDALCRAPDRAVK